MLRALAGERLHFEYSFEAPRSRQHFDCDVRLSAFRLDGAPQLLCLVRDLSEERRFSRQQEYLANHDALTGPNRQPRCASSISASRPAAAAFRAGVHQPGALQEVNEAFGHRAADMVLEISARARSAGSLHGWRLARAGGTDFVAVPPLPDHGGPGLPTETACELMLRVSREPITMGDTAVELHPKLGSAGSGRRARCRPAAALRRHGGGARPHRGGLTGALQQGFRAQPGPRPEDARRAVGPRSATASCNWPGGPSCGWRAARSRAWRPCCAGTTRAWAGCRRPSSSRWPSRPS
jgi:GGDEF domain-containing protein